MDGGRGMDLNTVTELARPRSRDEFAEWNDDAAWLAGSTWLFSEPQPHLRRLIDLAGLGWGDLEAGARGLRIGATCTLARLAGADWPADWRAGTLVGQCCGALLGSFKIAGAATVGGNLCLALPIAPMAALLTALDGTCRIWTPAGGERRLPAVAFVIGPQRNALRRGEVLRAVDLPADALRRRTAFRRTSLTPLGRSAALVIGTLAPDGAFALTVTASTPRPVRLDFPAPPGEAVLAARLDEEIPPTLYHDDVHGAPDWRRHVTRLLAEDIRREIAA
jgi:CO/xanthine dehydrogenase FAD-binding subunit